MSTKLFMSEKFLQERAVTETFLESPNERSFTDVFNIFTPQLVAFFRARNCERALAEDLAQGVMFTAYRKASQVRDRSLFRGWLFKIARNKLYRHYGKQTREVETVALEEITDRSVGASRTAAATPAFEFFHWMGFLDTREREAMTLRFVEEWEYSEIADAQAIPVGTAKWRVFNAKKKLASVLAPRQEAPRRAA